MSDLVIKISGDLKDYESALQAAQDKTEGLESGLASISKISGVAFASLTAEILLSAKAFGESQAASNRLAQSLANQNIYSDKLLKSYKDQAAELQTLTGVDDDSIISAQAVLQARIGQVEITKELTQATLDLAAGKKLDLETTADLIGKGIGGQTTALKKLGIEVDDSLTKQEKMAKVIELVTNKFGGQSEAANQGLGSIRGLHAAFSDFQENIGERFAPALEVIIKTMTNFFDLLNGNKAVADFVVSVILAGTVVSGLALTIGLGGLAFLKLKAALEAAEIATTAMSIATKGLIGATGIGLLIILATEIYLNWSSVWPKLQAVYAAFVENISDLSDGLAKVLKGTFSLNLDLIKQGLAEAKEAVQSGYDDIEAVSVTHEENKIAIKNKGITQQMEIDAARQALERQQIDDFNNNILASQSAYQALSTQQRDLFAQQSAGKLRTSLETEKSIKLLYAQQQVEQDVKQRNQFLLDEQKFGTAYAMINQQMHTEIYEGSKKAFGELGQLTQSSNAGLKAIGKAAAVANIIIKTGESAMNIFAGFSTIPFIGPALGVAGAAAAIAYGAEQIGTVMGAAEGGLITGGIPNVDSVPVLAQQGELVVPKQNFDEVVGAVSNQRQGGGGGDAGSAQIVISLKDDLMEFIEAKLVERSRLNISIQGA